MVSMSQVKLFISHSERDERFVVPLSRWFQAGLDLSKDAVRCTVDEPPDGDPNASESLRQDLLSAKVIVGVLSTNSLHSHWAQMEMGAGWLQERLQTLRGPGIAHADLPPPHDAGFTTGYCEKPRMMKLIRKIAETLDLDVQPVADRMLDEMSESAQEMLMADAVRWFSLPILLSAWTIDPNKYNHAFHALCDEDGLDIPTEDLMACVAPNGSIVGDPEQLPAWAHDHWAMSKILVNFVLSRSSRNPHRLQLPNDVLTGELVAGLKNALAANRKSKRSRLMQQWFDAARSYIATTPLTQRQSHSQSQHR